MHQRARKQEDKQERRDAILAVARALCRDGSPATVTMAEVAARAGLAKGTLYLYFRTREELLLELLAELLWDWFDEIDAGLAVPRRFRAARVAALLAGALERHPPLAPLLSILQAILEHNIELDAAQRFKQHLLARVATTGALLEHRLPRLPRRAGARALLHVNALVVGLQQMGDPAPVVRRVLEDPALRPLRIDFRRELPFALTALLEGFQRPR